MSIYVTIGVFLLLVVRDPAANRNLIAFAGWPNLAHAAVMAAREYRNVIERQEVAGVMCSQLLALCWSCWFQQSSQSRKALLLSPKSVGQKLHRR